MGKKKKPQKTKQLSVAIAEASSAGEELPLQQQSQPQTPRKRGRPRKNVERTESEEIKEEEAAEVTESQSKKLKTTEEPQQQQEQKPQAETSSASMGGMKKGEGQSDEREVSSFHDESFLVSQICCFISFSASNVNTDKHNTKDLAFSFPDCSNWAVLTIFFIPHVFLWGRWRYFAGARTSSAFDLYGTEAEL
ncbi:hypothetical protein GQ457_07G026290 [Hibiscus cannabinus]